MKYGKLVIVLTILFVPIGLLPACSEVRNISTDDLNVMDYGAVGDGLTDDTVAIQQAIDDAIAASTAVFLPQGEYLISETLLAVVNSFSHVKALRITGANSVLKATKNIEALLSVVGVAHFTMENLVFDGNQNATFGLKIKRVVSTLAKLKDIEVKNAISHGLFLDEAQLLLFENVVSAKNGGAGFYCIDCNGSWFDKTTALNNEGSGYVFASNCCSSFAYLRSAIAEGNQGHGVHYATSGQGGGVIHNSWIENNRGDGIRVDTFNVVVTDTNVQGTGFSDNLAIRITQTTVFSGGSRILGNNILGFGDPSYEAVIDETGVVSPDLGNVIRDNIFGSLSGSKPLPVLQAADSPFRSVIDVKTFGAVGDGVTDDTLALQYALDFGAHSGREVYLPRSEYAISAPLRINDGVKITGEWALIKALQPIDTMLFIKGVRYLDIKRLVLLGNGFASHGIQVRQVKGKARAAPGLTSTGLPHSNSACWSQSPETHGQCPVWFGQVEVRDTKGDGFVIESSSNIAIRNSASSINGGSGFVCRHCNYISLKEMSTVLNGQNGMQVTKSKNMWFDGAHAEINQGSGFVLQSKKVDLRHGWAEGNGLDSIVIEGNRNVVLYLRVINKGSNVRAVRIAKGKQNTVFGNNFVGGEVKSRTIRVESGENNELENNVYGLAASMRNLYLVSDANNACPVNTVCIEK